MFSSKRSSAVYLMYCTGSFSFVWKFLSNKRVEAKLNILHIPITDSPLTAHLHRHYCASHEPAGASSARCVCVFVFPSNDHDFHTCFFSISSPPFSTNYTHQLHPRSIVAVDSRGSNSSNLPSTCPGKTCSPTGQHA